MKMQKKRVKRVRTIVARRDAVQSPQLRESPLLRESLREIKRVQMAKALNTIAISEEVSPKSMGNKYLDKFRKTHMKNQKN